MPPTRQLCDMCRLRTGIHFVIRYGKRLLLCTPCSLRPEGT